MDSLNAELNRAPRMHARLAQSFEERAAVVKRLAGRVSLGRLVIFLLAGVVLVAGYSQHSTVLLWLAAGLLVLFVALVLWHRRLWRQREAAQVRAAVHQRHLQRLSDDWRSFASDGGGRLAEGHVYAADIDLIGAGSLFQRIDTTHTELGAMTLLTWLGGAALAESGSGAALSAQELRSRQRAVAELAGMVEFRQELEAVAEEATGADAAAPKLDEAALLKLADPSLRLMTRRWWRYALVLLPLSTVGLWWAGQSSLALAWWWLVPLVVQGVLVHWSARAVARSFDLIASRRGTLEAWCALLVLCERQPFEASKLQTLQERLQVGGLQPSAYLRRVDLWAGLAELRQQVPLHIVLNYVLLWDLQVLSRLEGLQRRVAGGLQVAIAAFAELEALSALGGFAFREPEAVFPTLSEAAADGVVAMGMGHPLLPVVGRVANDVQLSGPGSALIVTGSNMAGKSTLLRSMGLNIALALAGAPVCAVEMRLPMLRLRASMRAIDSLQRGASYFHAELQKLRQVIDAAAEQPPVFFLLDELLRGTNASARSQGAHAVIVHLLDRGAMGLVATHDTELAGLEQQRPGRVANAHFTDSVDAQQHMHFDYRLRPGVVQGSNALRLLRGIGVEVAAG